MTVRYAYFDRGANGETVLLSDTNGIATEEYRDDPNFPDFHTDASVHGASGASFFHGAVDDRHFYFTAPFGGAHQRFRGYIKHWTAASNADRVFDLRGTGTHLWLDRNPDGSYALHGDGNAEVGTFSTPQAAHEVARVHVDVYNDYFAQSAVVVHLWTTDPESTGAPDHELAAILTDPVTALRFGTIYNDGSVSGWDSIAKSDGEPLGPIAVDDDPFPYSAWVGAVTDTTATVTARGDVPLSLRLGTAPGTYIDNASVDLTPDATTGMVTFSLTGLSANTRYYWEIYDNATGAGVLNGELLTHPPVGEAASFRFGASSCAGLEPLTPGQGDCYLNYRISNYVGHDTIRARGVANDWMFFIHMGDMVYYNPSQSNPYSRDFYRQQWNEVLQQPNQAALYRQVPLVYSWDDHDYGPNDSTAAAAGRLNAQQAYRDMVPHYPLPAIAETDGNHPIYHSTQVGRVLFLVSDVRSSRVPYSTLLGQQQKDWMRDVLANSAAQLLIWVTPTPWYAPAAWAGDDTWGYYETEANELVQMFTDTGFVDRMVAITGDTHHMAIDDGTSGVTYGGIPLAVCGPIDSRVNSGAAVPYSHGAIGHVDRGQHAEFDVTDTGTNITITAHGYHMDTLVLSATVGTISTAVSVSAAWTTTVTAVADALAVTHAVGPWYASATQTAGASVVAPWPLSTAWAAAATLTAPLTDPVPVPAATVWAAEAVLDGWFNVRARAATAWLDTATLSAGLTIRRIAAAAAWSTRATVAATLTWPAAAGIRWAVTIRFAHRPIEHEYHPPAYPWFIPTVPDTRRIWVQEILSGEWLEDDLPLGEVEYTRQLCGPTVISGAITPETPRALVARLETGAVWLHVEDAGQIMASGMLAPGELDGPTAALEAEGFSGYAHGIPYRDEWTLASSAGIGVAIDPTDVVRECWRHIQSYDDGNLGVTVDDTTSPVRIGEEKRDVSFETSTGEQVEFTAGPYTLDWWENPLIGQEIDKLAVETPFEYREDNYWNADKTDVIHRLRLAYPRIGRRRTDLHFEQGRGIVSMLPFAENDEYASEVIVTGRGEGRAAVTGSAMTRRGRRVRQVKLVNDKTIGSKRRARTRAQDVLGVYSPIYEIKEIEVLAWHSDAVAGSYDVGDDIYVQGEVAYLGDVALWHRIVSLKPSHTSGTVILSLLRTERFIYGPMGQTALLAQTDTGAWIPPNSIEGTGGSQQPRVRDVHGNWIPIG